MFFEPFIPVAIFALAWLFFARVLNTEMKLEEIRVEKDSRPIRPDHFQRDPWE